MIALLLRLYPARWRARYGDEFAALLQERQLGPFDVADVLLAALDAHLHLRGLGSWSEHRRGFPMSLRIGAYAAIAGGALMLTGLLWASLDAADSDPGIWLFLAGMVSLLVALAGLSAFQAREHPALVWAAFLLPAVGGVVTTLGVIAMGIAPDRPVLGDQSGWFFFIVGLLATVAGSVLFAAATWATGTLPRSAAALLGVTCAISLTAFVVSIAGGDAFWEPLRLLFAFAYLAFPAGWVLFGALALRADRPAAAPSPA
jgi:hypothetical protein